MSHQGGPAEELSELELVELDNHSEDKFKKIHKDLLGLHTESDIVLSKLIPEMNHKIDRVHENVIIVREDHADTNRVVRKLNYDTIPALTAKIGDLSSKVEKIPALTVKVNDLSIKVDDFSAKMDDLSRKVDLLCSKIDGLISK